MIRDLELARLINYGKALNTAVIFYKDKEDAGSWSLDGSEIHIHWPKSSTKTDVILTLLHELGHHAWFIHVCNRQQHQPLYNALNAKKPTKRQRKVILDCEIAATKWWNTIIKEADIQIPTWKVERQMELDLWMYEYFYANSDWPNWPERNLKYKDLTFKYKPKKETK